jgi:hypothetical protein
MRFLKFLNENLYHSKEKDDMLKKKYKISEKDILLARKSISAKRKIDENKLDYAFIWEMNEDPPIVFISFNVEDPNNKSLNKSTLNYKWLPLNKRGA